MDEELKKAVAEAIAYCEANRAKGFLRQAEVYLKALPTAIEEYGLRAIPTQLLYALGNMSAWKGEDARRVKAVLKKYSKTGD